MFLNLFCSLNPSSGRYCARYTCALSGSGPPARAWAACAAGPRRSFCGPAVARPRVVPGSFPSARACFSWPPRCVGLPQRFSWPRCGFPLPAIKKARQPFVIITLDPLSEHFRGLRGAELPSWRGVAAKRELEIIAKPLGLLHDALLSGRSFLRTETRSYSLPLQRIACRLPICLVRCSPIFAVRLLHRSRSSRRFAFAAFDLLSCAGVEADSW